MKIQYILTYTKEGIPNHVGMRLQGKDFQGQMVSSSFGGYPNRQKKKLIVMQPNIRIETQLREANTNKSKNKKTKFYNVLMEDTLTPRDIERINGLFPGIFERYKSHIWETPHKFADIERGNYGKCFTDNGGRGVTCLQTAEQVSNGLITAHTRGVYSPSHASATRLEINNKYIKTITPKNTYYHAANHSFETNKFRKNHAQRRVGEMWLTNMDSVKTYLNVFNTLFRVKPLKNLKLLNLSKPGAIQHVYEQLASTNVKAAESFKILFGAITPNTRQTQMNSFIRKLYPPEQVKKINNATIHLSSLGRLSHYPSNAALVKRLGKLLPHLDGIYSNPRLSTGSAMQMNNLEIVLFKPRVDKDISIEKKYTNISKKSLTHFGSHTTIPLGSTLSPAEYTKSQRLSSKKSKSK